MKNATIGRVVHLATSQEEHVPAIVTGVNGDESINLHIFPNSSEGAYFRRGVTQDNYAGEHAQQDTWHWPEGSREFKDSEPKAGESAKTPGEGK
jgi:hypothetical protein